MPGALRIDPRKVEDWRKACNSVPKQESPDGSDEDDSASSEGLRHWPRRLSITYEASVSDVGVVYPKSEFYPGIIIQALVADQTVGEPDDKSRYGTPFGTLCIKFRPLVVVACYEEHYVALPFFTHQGKGLKWKLNPQEFVSIRDSRRTEPFTALSSHPELTTNWMTKFVNPLAVNTTVQMTHPISRSYQHACWISGCLEDESIVALLKLYRCLKAEV